MKNGKKKFQCFYAKQFPPCNFHDNFKQCDLKKKKKTETAKITLSFLFDLIMMAFSIKHQI